jgi:Amt family ammonium transporter
MENTYQSCLADLTTTNSSSSPTAEALLQCISNSFDASRTNTNDAVDAFFLLFASTLVFFMQTGFAMVCAGSVRLENVQNTLLKNILDACAVSFGFYSVGYAFAYGISSSSSSTTTFIGNSNFFLMNVDDDDYAFWFFQFAFCATSGTIVAGALAERCQITAYLAYSLFLSSFVYPVVVHAIWSNNGFLSAQNVHPLWDSGMIDFAGSCVVHITGGATALIASKVLGPRTGRFHDIHGNMLENPKEMPGHSLALQCLGVSSYSRHCVLVCFVSVVLRFTRIPFYSSFSLYMLWLIMIQRFFRR